MALRQPNIPTAASIDATDVARFERLGAEWWDPQGPMRALHKINPVRIGYLRDAMAAHFGGKPPKPLAALRILDIGCGAGLLSEPLARLGAAVTGVDPAPGNIAVARSHAEKAGLSIDYQAETAENLAAAGGQFDVVLAMEVVEHVNNMPDFVRTACSLVRPGGLFFASTLNRTLKSFALAIVGAEYVLGWVAKGTHQWEKFVTPTELKDAISRAGLRLTDETGLIFNPLSGEWRLSADTGVNYFVTAARPPLKV
jgi:2-polyprenyl-6-hydroxyphenyl methylase / 3-demethylubiquinone-9 3-methyltransferase